MRRIGWTFSCLSFKVIYLAGLRGPLYSHHSDTHVTANTAWSQKHAKTINIYRKAGNHPRVSNLALPKMWHLPLFYCTHAASTILPLVALPIPPSHAASPPLLPSHPLIPLHTSINRALQSAQSHTVLNAAVVQLQWAATDLYHWIKRGRKAERAKTRDEPHFAFFYPPFLWTDA